MLAFAENGEPSTVDQYQFSPSRERSDPLESDLSRLIFSVNGSMLWDV
jgi:hypothetical protein